MDEKNFDEFQVVEYQTNKNKGLLAARIFLAGADIYQFDYWSRQLMPMHMTNHSCDPNASFNASGMLVALRDIASGEEITYDYVAHPIPASPWSFECLCGASNCRDWVSVTSDNESN